MSDDFDQLLALTETARDRYRAEPSFGGEREHLFGGQVLAQALCAATGSVPEERRAHSLHGYFLRRGTNRRPLELQVFRDRDGRSFSARRVLAVQDDEVLFSAALSFHVEEDGPEFQHPITDDVIEPEDCPEVHGGSLQFFDARGVPGQGSDDGKSYSSRLWVRPRSPLHDRELAHLCALAYVTDLGSGFANLGLPGLAPAGPTIDHAIWFHRPIRLDDWVLIDLWPLRASGARGTYMGSVHDRQGTLGCMLAQEALLRPWPSGRPGR